MLKASKFIVKASKLMILVISTSPLSVLAADGSIIINGKVIDATCTLTTDGGAEQGRGNVTVTLPTIKTSEFGTAKVIKGATDFDLRIVDDATGAVCASLAGIKGILISAPSVRYLADDTTALMNQKNKDDAAAAGGLIQVQLLDASKTVVNFRSPPTLPHINGSIKMTAQYYQAVAGVIAPQNVQAIVDYTMIYN